MAGHTEADRQSLGRKLASLDLNEGEYDALVDLFDGAEVAGFAANADPFAALGVDLRPGSRSS